MQVADIVSRQKSFFETEQTKSLTYRLTALKKLQKAIQDQEEKILHALQLDLGKPYFESYMSEVGIVQNEIRYIIKNLPKWAKNKRCKTPWMYLPAKSFIKSEPYGTVLIMAPWNYPFLLCLLPLIGAMTAGNSIVLKPSAYAPNTSSIVAQLIQSCFDAEYIAVVEGGREENTALLEELFDKIFFTGSPNVGKIVLEKAAKHLTPTTLELGGKSPCIVDETANIALAGKRIAFGKYLNAGQTCVAPDYILVQQSVKDALLQSICNAIQDFYGASPLEGNALPKIIHQKHFERLLALMQNETVYCGGDHNAKTLQIAPTVLVDVTADSPVMQEEIFGPILPVPSYQTLEDAISFVKSKEKPLALYIFSTDKQRQNKIMNSCSYGGGCINDTILHNANHHLPFGGVGKSGMGSYHGKKSFETFSHQKSIFKKANWMDLTLRYPPANDFVYRLLKKILR